MSIIKDKSVKNGIVASLIAAIVFYIVLEPLMRLVWRFLNRYSSVLYTNYMDSIYKTAAYGHRNDIDFVVFSFLMIALIVGMITFGIYIKHIRDTRKFKEELKNTENVDEIFQKVVDKKKEIRKKIAILDKFGNVVEMFIAKGRYVIYIFILFAGFTLVFQSYVDLMLNTTFNQRLNAIAPYIDDSQRKVLVSKWALMESKNDYMEIKLMVENIAKENNIKLPKALIK